MSEEEEGGLFPNGLIIGGLIGLALGILYAPSPGSETRAKLKEKIKELKEDSEKAVEEIKESSEKLIETTKSAIEEGLSRLSVAVEEAKRAAKEKRAELEEELK